ncbi:carboxypeptidase-like regulatory domain-containing protein [Pontibacter litorisediminis]|uniref:carboxypeptidase-like regulatory domain-containing protein n=1 Tax=Pontibacter litorisediminis TaxID=1846260 RepID=UPI0023EBA097|nr:carboxypeptidase-like regulatory domain-containing protein [Pontibacter litorisediminis]
MKTSFICLFILMLLITSGCKDRDRLNEPCSGNCVTITGKVTTENNSAVAASGVSLKLSWARPAVPLGSPQRDIATTTTDDKGNYTFVFTPKSDELQDGRYLIEYSKEGFFPADISFYGISRGDTTIKQNIHIVEKET